MLPAVEIVTASEPEEEVDEVQEAEHEDAFVEVHVSVEVFPNKTDVGSAEKFIDGAGVIGVESPLPPPPPPPPHDERTIIASRWYKVRTNYFGTVSILGQRD